MAELVDARDLKSLGALSLYRFDSGPRHQIIAIKLRDLWPLPVLSPFSFLPGVLKFTPTFQLIPGQ